MTPEETLMGQPLIKQWVCWHTPTLRAKWLRGERELGGYTVRGLTAKGDNQ